MKNLRLLVIVGLVILMTTVVAYAQWEPPIGIPAPDFGIEETHYMYEGQTYDFGSGPEAYPDAGNGPYTHYIDCSHAAATDDANPYGTPAKPRMTIPTTVPAGSVVEIHNGDYSSMSVVGNGTASKPVFIRGISPENKARIVKNTGEGDHLVLTGSTYMIVENLEIHGSKGFRIFQVSRYVCVRNCECTGWDRIMFNLFPSSSWSSGDTIEHIVIYNNEIHHDAKWPAVDTMNHGLAVNQGCKWVWFVDNLVYNVGEDGIHLWGGPDKEARAPHPQYVYIGRNHIYDCGENAIDIKTSEHVIISQNELHGHRSISSSAGAAIVLNNDHSPAFLNDYLWVIFNEIYDNHIGVECRGWNKSYVIGNNLHDMFHPWNKPDSTAEDSGTAIMAGFVNKELHIIGNTMSRNHAGIRVWGGENFFIENNVITDLTPLGEGEFHLSLDHTEGQEYFVKNNLFYDTEDGSVTPGLPAEQYADNIFDRDPLLTVDYKLNPGSPAFDTGILSNAYDTFQTLYGIDIKVDYDGSIRPQDAGWDMGAFESYSGKVAIPIMTPVEGQYLDSLEVTISTYTPDASIYYTLDGSDPDDSSILYTSPIMLGLGNTTVKAKAYKIDIDPSEISTSTYEIISDTFPPTIVDVSALGGISNRVNVTFDEEVELTSSQDISNYSISGLTIYLATLQPDNKTIILTTSEMAEGTYLLQASGILDRATTPNIMLSEDHEFSYTEMPYGLVANYKFEGDIIDSSGLGNDGEVNNNVDFVTGKESLGASFNSSGDYIQIPTTSMSPLQGTVLMWVKPGTVPSSQFIFGHTTGTTLKGWPDRIQLYTNDPSGNLDLGLGDQNERHLNIFDLDNEWRHIALTWDNGTYNVYVDASPSASGAYTGLDVLKSFADIGNNGNQASRDEGFNGIIDEVMIYERALSSEEVQQLYDPGSVLLGDVNGSGDITIYDAALAVKVALGIPDPNIKYPEAADFNQDGDVTIYDAALIVKEALGL